MNRLEEVIPVKERFNPYNKQHMQSAKQFFSSYRWGQYGCPFVLEWPYEDIPYMLKTKITEYVLKV